MGSGGEGDCAQWDCCAEPRVREVMKEAMKMATYKEELVVNRRNERKRVGMSRRRRRVKGEVDRERNRMAKTERKKKSDTMKSESERNEVAVNEEKERNEVAVNEEKERNEAEENQNQSTSRVDLQSIAQLHHARKDSGKVRTRTCVSDDG